MSGWIYLIRNKDLYKIGITKNFDNRMCQLKPDNVVAKLFTNDFLRIERELHNRYKKFRIPQTEYFRLKEYHLREIKQIILNLEYPMSLTLRIFITSLIVILLIFFLVFIFIYLNINDLNIVTLKSILWMEKISFGLSIFSILFRSGKYLSFLSEVKYRFSRLAIFLIFSIFFRLVSIFLN